MAVALEQQGNARQDFCLRDGAGVRAACHAGMGRSAASRPLKRRFNRFPVTARNDQITHPSIPSLEFVPNTPPAALLIQVSAIDQIAEVLLQRVSANPSQLYDIADRDASVFTGKVDDLQ